jgi:hypothetical protein
VPVPKITATQFATNLATNINQRDSSVDTTIGPVYDLVIQPSSRVFEAQNDRIRYLFSLLTLQNPNSLVASDVTAFVFNEQVIPSAGTPSFVTLTFVAKALPQTNLPVPANFPVATLPDPTTGVQTIFVTLTPATLIAANAAAYFNSTTNQYELNVVAGSITSGQATSVNGSGLVTQPLRPLPGFDSVTNNSISTGGLPAEVNQDVVNRYFLRIQGTELGTGPGLARYALQTFSNIQDLYVVYGNNPFLTRQAFDAGAVDVWVQGSSPIQTVQIVNFPGQLVLIPFQIQPGISVQSVMSGSTTFVQNVDYEYTEDTGIWSGSTEGQDGITFLPTGSAPAIGASVIINYTYENLIVACQSFFQTAEYQETGRDQLFRRALELPATIQGQLTVNAGNPTSVLANVIQALLDYVNGSTTQSRLGLGEELTEFNLDGVLSTIPGVGNFTYQVLAPTGQQGVQDIPTNPNQYVTLDPSALTVTLA